MSTTNPIYRTTLPQLTGRSLLTDGGLETALIYEEAWDLPEFAAFVLLDSASGKASLKQYYQGYIDIALANRSGFLLESPTWRASSKWGSRIGYSKSDLVDINHRAIQLLAQLRAANATPSTPIVISGCIGPEDDGYSPTQRLTVEQAADYHSPQVQALANTNADMLCAITMTYIEEAIGICEAANQADMPLAISFTVETDGRLPSGMGLAEAINKVDAATHAAPIYYMINCAHPTHFAHILAQGGDWLQRIGGLRANASRKSHAELDAAVELDTGDPEDFGKRYNDLLPLLPNLAVLGGCCGTNYQHVRALADFCELQ